MFENIKYGSYPQNAGFYELFIEFEKILFTKLQIDCLTDDKLEKLKVISKEQSVDNIIYESNPQNDDFDDLSFHGDKRVIIKMTIISYK